MSIDGNSVRTMVACLAATLFASACQDGAAAGPTLAGERQPIYNGSLPDRPEHGAVVGLHRFLKGGRVSAKPFCTGTLITPRVVLTAAHCLDVAGGGAAFRTAAPADVGIYVGNNPALDLSAHLYRVTETRIHPSYDRIRLLNDIALIRLTSPITEVQPVAALPASLGFTSADFGPLHNFAGFGEIEDGTHGIKLQVDGPLRGFGCVVEGCEDGGHPPTQVSYDMTWGGPCFGDSGGPMFIYRDSTPYVGSLTSYGDAYCTGYGVNTRVDAYESWISSFAAPPVSACGNGTCDAGESCDGRTGTEKCSSDCAGNMGGKPSARWCTVGATCVGPGC